MSINLALQLRFTSESAAALRSLVRARLGGGCIYADGHARRGEGAPLARPEAVEGVAVVCAVARRWLLWMPERWRGGPQRCSRAPI